MTMLRGRWPATLGIALFAALALFSGFDRLSSHQPGDERLVPAPFRADAARVTAARHLVAGELDLASASAREAILADPADARGPAFLGAAAYASGDEALGGEAMKVAAAISAREPLAQGAFTAIAMDEGRVADAARHFDILLRVHPETRVLDGLFAIMESREEGRAELARRLGTQSLWTDAYLRAEGQDAEVVRERAAFLTRNAGAIPLGCARIDPLVRELARRNYRADAQALHRAQCSAAASGQLLADPAFDKLGEDALCWWRRHGSGGVRIAAAGGAVELANRTSVTRLVLSQPVALEAGEYRAFASVAGSQSDTLLASLDCGQPERPSQAGGALARGQLLRAKGCEDEVFGIWLRPGSGTVTLDNVRLQRVGQGD